jgi:hypothetical protein
MEINEFISAINATIPSIEQIIKKFNWDFNDSGVQKAQLVQSEYRLTIKNEAKDWKDLEDLVYNTNINDVPVQIGSVVFRQEIKVIRECYQWFATYNDYHRISLNVKEGSIVWFEGDAEEYDTLTISLGQFLSFMYIYDLYSKNQVWQVNFSKAEFSIKLKNLIENGLSEWFVSTLMYDWPW